MWQVILGRVISGAGASGMAGLVSILITGASKSHGLQELIANVTQIYFQSEMWPSGAPMSTWWPPWAEASEGPWAVGSLMP
jgi:hypothetical protein